MSKRMKMVDAINKYKGFIEELVDCFEVWLSLPEGTRVYYFKVYDFWMDNINEKKEMINHILFNNFVNVKF